MRNIYIHMYTAILAKGINESSIDIEDKIESYGYQKEHIWALKRYTYQVYKGSYYLSLNITDEHETSYRAYYEIEADLNDLFGEDGYMKLEKACSLNRPTKGQEKEWEQLIDKQQDLFYTDNIEEELEMRTNRKHHWITEHIWRAIRASLILAGTATWLWFTVPWLVFSFFVGAALVDQLHGLICRTIEKLFGWKQDFTVYE